MEYTLQNTNPDIDYSVVDVVDTFFSSPDEGLKLDLDTGRLSDIYGIRYTLKIFPQFTYWLDTESVPGKALVKRAAYKDQYYINQFFDGAVPVEQEYELNGNKNITVEKDGRYIPHSLTSPAYMSGTSSSWYALGKAHRSDGPAIEQANTLQYYRWGYHLKNVVMGKESLFFAGHQLDADSSKLFEEGNLRFRLAGPDLAVFEIRVPGDVERWALHSPNNGTIAAVFGKDVSEWYKMGVIHKDNGFARIYNAGSATGQGEYWVDGVKFSVYEGMLKTDKMEVVETITASDGQRLRKIIYKNQPNNWLWINDDGLLHNPSGPVSANGLYSLYGINLNIREFEESKKYNIEPRKNLNGNIVWCKKNTSTFHRICGPAIVNVSDASKNKYYYNGSETRKWLLSEAVRQGLKIVAHSSQLIYSENWTCIVNENGAAHSWTGPAIEYGDGQKFYAIHGVWISEATFKSIVNTKEQRGIIPSAFMGSPGMSLRYLDKDGRLHREDGPAEIFSKGARLKGNDVAPIWAWHGEKFNSEDAWKKYQASFYVKDTDKKDTTMAAEKVAVKPTVAYIPDSWLKGLDSKVEIKQGGTGYDYITGYKEPLVPKAKVEAVARVKKEAIRPLKKSYYGDQSLSTILSIGDDAASTYWTVKAGDIDVLRVYGVDVYGQDIWNHITIEDGRSTYGEYFKSADYGNRLYNLVREKGAVAALEELGLFDDSDGESSYEDEDYESPNYDDGISLHNKKIPSNLISKLEAIGIEMNKEKEAPEVAKIPEIHSSSDLGLGGLLGMAIAGGALAGLIDWKARKRKMAQVPKPIVPVEPQLQPEVINKPALAEVRR